MGIIKSQTDLRLLKDAGKVAGEVCDLLMEQVQPGVSTMALEQQANTLLAMRRSSAPFKLYEGFNHATCISLNEEIVNGPPSRERVIKEGDVVSIAIGSCVRGFYGKAARTVYVGKNPSDEIQRLLDGTRAVFDRAIEHSKTAKTLNEILALMPQVAAEYRLSLVKESGGCGIGKQLHEPPPTYNYPEDMPGEFPLVPGLAFTLMPMMCLGESGSWILHEDGWTQVTEDGSVAAHFAETMLMTEDGLIMLTR